MIDDIQPTINKRCQICGDEWHAPGQSERSNCGDDELIQSKLRLVTASNIDAPQLSMCEARVYWNEHPTLMR